MQPFITANREKIAAICREHHIDRLSVFGSAVRDDFDPERSDVDVLVNFTPEAIPKYISNYQAFRDQLETLFQRRVDVIREGVIRNPVRLKCINNDKVLVYAA